VYKTGKMHMVNSSKIDPDRFGQGLGRCYTYGLITSDPDKVDCKNCLKRMNSVSEK
jgi:hypothetical protein